MGVLAPTTEYRCIRAHPSTTTRCNVVLAHYKDVEDSVSDQVRFPLLRTIAENDRGDGNG